MLREIKTSKNKDKDFLKRWFNDEIMDLIVWIDEKGSIAKFQLCYDKNFSEHALTWNKSAGFQHNKVDDGEGRAGKHKGSPILVPDGQFDTNIIADKFRNNSKSIDNEICEFVYEKLLSFQKT